MSHVLSTICLRMNLKEHVAYNFNSLFDTEGHLKVARNHVQCKCDSILEIVQDGVVIITDH